MICNFKNARELEREARDSNGTHNFITNMTKNGHVVIVGKKIAYVDNGNGLEVRRI